MRMLMLVTAIGIVLRRAHAAHAESAVEQAIGDIIVRDEHEWKQRFIIHFIARMHRSGRDRHDTPELSYRYAGRYWSKRQQRSNLPEDAADDAFELMGLDLE